MKILVTYFSQTGNTEKVARAMYDSLKDRHETTIKRFEELGAGEPAGFDILFIGSPCHAGDLSAPAKELLKSLPASMNTAVAGFVTHAATVYRREDYGQCLETLQSSMEEKGIRLLGCFDCQGYLAPAIHDFVKKHKKIPDDEWKQRVEEMTGHPDAEDLRRAAEFARETAGAADAAG
ncbi:MAG: flavodoxin [Spirochaetes bacterium]|nr:flavodoxin [Spirochaetota bacterium]